jgi:hypothetical protein
LIKNRRNKNKSVFLPLQLLQEQGKTRFVCCNKNTFKFILHKIKYFEAKYTQIPQIHFFLPGWCFYLLDGLQGCES